jgi:hypothetical protein
MFKPSSVAAVIVAALALGFSWFSLTTRPVDIETRLAVARHARQTAEALLQSHRVADAEQAGRQALATLDYLAAHASRDVRYRRERAFAAFTRRADEPGCHLRQSGRLMPRLEIVC